MLWVTILTYLTNSLSFLSDFCWNKNKNKPKQPLLYSLFQDSEGTSTSTETNNTSYESPATQLIGALRMRVWHHLGGATPTSRKSDCYFSFWGRGGHVRLMKWKNNVLNQISLSHDPKNHWLWITVSLNHEQMFVWNASIWVGGPCIVIVDIETSTYPRLNIHDYMHSCTHIRTVGSKLTKLKS